MLKFMLMKFFVEGGGGVSTSNREQATSKYMNLQVILNIPCLRCSDDVCSIIGEIHFTGGL